MSLRSNVIFVLCVVFVKMHTEYGVISSDVDDSLDKITSLYKKIDTILDNETAVITFNKETNTLLLRCNSKNLVDMIPLYKATNTVKELLIVNCVLPPAPLVETLAKLNIEPTIEMLQLAISNRNPLPTADYTKGLNLKTILIDSRYSVQDVLSNNPNFLQPLSNLKTLIIWSNKLLQIPENMKLEVLSLRHNVWVKNWEKCEDLRELRLINMEFDEGIPNKWPSSCSRLTTLQLRGMADVAVQKLLASGISECCKDLNVLTMRSCNQTTIPYAILRVAKNLVTLNLSRNKIIDQSFTDFPVMESLTHLNLSNNHLEGSFLSDLVQKLPALQYLDVSGNKFSNLYCDYERRTFSLANLQSLEWLSLNDMPLHRRCFINHKFPKLKFLGLAYTDRVDDFYLNDLPQTNSSHLEVDFRGRLFERFTGFLNDSYAHVLSGDPAGFWPSFAGNPYDNTNITLLMSHINCDCQNYWFARTMRESNQKFVTLPGLRCWPSDRAFNDEKFDDMNCLKDDWLGCVVKRTGTYFTKEYDERKGTAECPNATDKLKIVIRNGVTLSGLNLSNGSITSLKRISTLPDSLQWFDLRNNNISRLDDTDISLLFPNTKRKVWLKGNLIFCDCANKNLLDALHMHHNQVMDFKELTCLETGTPLQLVTSYEVCRIGLRIAIGIVSFIIVLFLTSLFVLWNYRTQVKMYMYSRGLCLSCFQEELDTERPYDAFLSFAHGDDEYVMKHLLPRLEGEPDFYRICVHYRDWVAGNWIPSQIMQSVEESKRTVIVLSRNFVSSMWGTLEFRYAIASAAEKGKSRLIVLILDDVFSDKLDAEIQGYLSFNTYLRCDDPWFWEKLRYAMPKRESKSKISLPNSEEANVTIPLDSVHL